MLGLGKGKLSQIRKGETNEEAEWLRHLDLVKFMLSDEVHAPWFPAFKSSKSPRRLSAGFLGWSRYLRSLL